MVMKLIDTNKQFRYNEHVNKYSSIVNITN